ncbi:HSPB1-associated protein 1 [Gastrophryne carolinensis]
MPLPLWGPVCAAAIVAIAIKKKVRRLAEAARSGSRKKPFTPQEVREIVFGLDRPAIFLDMADDWPALRWSAARLSDILREKSLRFRIGKRKVSTEPQFETQCDYIEGTIEQFRAWVGGSSPKRCGPFGQFDGTRFWAYADYKYLALLFDDRPENLQDVLWGDFGFPGRGGRESTLWVGSRGANTPCHIDSYGCNLVLQVEGRKRWHLFPPEDTERLYPTRIPYEESSVFSKVNVVNPDRKRHPLFSGAHPHVVTLHPGQVLFVPRHWWHYVESVDDVTVSVNSWIELDADHEARVEEAVTRLVVCAFKSAEGSAGPSHWLNPTEGEVTSHETNMEYLNRALTACRDHQRGAGPSSSSAPEVRDAPPPCKKSRGTSDWFGRYLIPVLPVGGDIDTRDTSSRASEPALEVIRDAVLEPSDNGRRGSEPALEVTRDAVLEPSGNSSPASEPALEATGDTRGDELSINSSPDSEQALEVTGDTMLDCLVDPRVMRLVARLLLQRSCR